MEKVEVLDIFGRKLMEQIVALSSDLVVDLSGHAPGVYLVQVSTENGTVTRKIVLR